MYKLDSRELTRDDLSQWDALVDHSIHGTIFHKTDWLNACAQSLGKKVKIFGCFQDGLLVGGCSLFISQKWGIIPFAESICIMTPYGGFVLSSPPTKNVRKQETFSRQIIETLKKDIKKEHFFTTAITNAPEFLDIRPFTMNGWRSNVLYTYYMYLDNNIESHIDPSVKKNIRKAEKNGIIIEPFSNISRYYALYCETLNRKNVKSNATKGLFTELFSLMRNHNCGEMVVAKTSDDEIACAEIYVWDNQKAYSLSAVSDVRFLYSGATSLLRVNMMKRMQDRGIPKIDMTMGLIPQLSKFASRFNPTIVPYYQIQSWISDDIRGMKNLPRL
ncbi:MAG: GNAT family N-acetyltransferase [Deltaproteobacteria bacterium]|nr:GNAT family N-acetyltransferase [Deltaproteobacteria bacterium]